VLRFAFMAGISLRVENVYKAYAGHQALTDVSIDVDPGSIYGLLGPNGAGKTSLIRIINRITAPDSGRIFIDGRPLSPDHTSIIGYLPEERGLYKKMKIGEQMIYLARLKGMSQAMAKQRLIHWFEKFEIQLWWDKKVEELSKGMAQKVQFISTVLHEPRLLILDEPFSGFDPVNAQLIRNEIFQLKKNGATIILSTHNMTSVEEICDKIALIDRSKKVLEGSVSSIRAEHKSDLYRMSFKGSLLAFTNALWANFELVNSETKDEVHECEVKLLRGNSLNRLIECTLPHVELISVQEVLPGMSDIFVKMVSTGSQIK